VVALCRLGALAHCCDKIRGVCSARCFGQRADVGWPL
jgi:hypothetical protein